ncbi:MAG: ABC transporter ATP-binding protein, partial [Candidatus Methanomethyliaceae archaeon]
LRDVSFEVKRGEVVGIIGRNGAGKTTLLKILSRITDPTEGYAEIHGRVGSLLEVGTGFHPELTGRENIYLNGAILGMKKAEIDRYFDEIVEFAEIEKFLDTPVKRYSSGMYVRLAFAVAAHLQPEILLVDEVLAVGDAAFQKKCLGKMGDVAREGRTVLFVSHNMEAIRRLCEQAILLECGKLRRWGEVESVISDYIGQMINRRPERVWPSVESAPGDNIVRLHAVRVNDDKGNVNNTFDIRRPIFIEIHYWNLAEGIKRAPGIHVWNDQGICVFMSYDHSSSEWQQRVFPRGLIKSRCRIPGNFLAEGRFWVTVAINTEVGQSFAHVVEKDVVSFEVFDPGEGDSVRGENQNKWGGVVRPMLEWETIYE